MPPQALIYRKGHVALVTDVLGGLLEWGGSYFVLFEEVACTTWEEDHIDFLDQVREGLLRKVEGDYQWDGPRLGDP